MEKNGEKFPIESTPEFARLTSAGRAMELPADPEEESQSLLTAILNGTGSFEFFGISYDGIGAMIVGLGEVESREDESSGDESSEVVGLGEALGIQFEGRDIGLSRVFLLKVDSTRFIFPDFNRNQESQCTIAVPLSLNDNDRCKLRTSAISVGFTNPILVNEALSIAVGFRFGYQAVFSEISKRKVVLLVDFGRRTNVSLVSFWFHEVDVLGSLFNEDEVDEGEPVLLLLNLRVLVAKLLKRCKFLVGAVDFILLEEGNEAKQGLGKCFLEIFGKEVELMVFKPSTVAIGAAIICAWILKPKDDFRSWPEVEVGKFELRRLKIVQGRDRSCPSCWRVDNLSNSSDYFEDGSPVYANWEEESPKAFGWRFTLEGLRACVDYGHPSPTEEELMIEYRMYDESSRDVGDIVTFGMCECCDLFICSRCRKARCWICWYKLNKGSVYVAG